MVVTICKTTWGHTLDHNQTSVAVGTSQAITSQNSPRRLERICYELWVEGYIWKCVTIFNSTHQLRSETGKFQLANCLLPCVIYGI